MADQQKKVLVIDDEAHIRRVLELKLKNNGYKVITADNGKTGYDAIKSEAPDAVISDIQMPKIDGKALCEMCNPMKQERPFLTIIMTSAITQDRLIWIKEMTDTHFMEKPFSPKRVVATVNQYFGN